MVFARIASIVLVFSAGNGFLACAFASSEAPPEKESRVELTRSEANFIDAINAYRADYKLPPLRVDPILLSVARARVNYLDASRDGGEAGYNHQALGMWCWGHASREGFDGWATDNLAMGCISTQEAVDAWASEDDDADPAGHNYQMRGLFKMNGRWQDYRFNRIGVAVSDNRYIAIFGRLE